MFGWGSSPLWKSGLLFPYITSLEQNYVPQLCHHEAVRLALANEM